MKGCFPHFHKVLQVPMGHYSSDPVHLQDFYLHSIFIYLKIKFKRFMAPNATENWIKIIHEQVLRKISHTWTLVFIQLITVIDFYQFLFKEFP